MHNMWPKLQCHAQTISCPSWILKSTEAWGNLNNVTTNLVLHVKCLKLHMYTVSCTLLCSALGTIICSFLWCVCIWALACLSTVKDSLQWGTYKEWFSRCKTQWPVAVRRQCTPLLLYSTVLSVPCQWLLSVKLSLASCPPVAVTWQA